MSPRIIRTRLCLLAIALAVWQTWPATVISATQVEVLLPRATAKDQVLLQSSQQFSQQISALEWLGPLAPIALSPFFGLACLSGIATYGPDWLQQRSALFSDTSPLANPALFWTMAVLTVITSLPRFSKVSKPLALLAEKLEAYSVVVILVAMRTLGAPDVSTSSETAMATQFLSAGLSSDSLQFLLTLVAALNVIVVNSVKLFCELMIWLIPFPFVDAIFEVGNKMICVGLMSLYSWSPTAAMIFNVLLFAICGYVYFWTKRRMIYYWDVLAGPMIGAWIPWLFGENVDGRRMFLAEPWQGMPKFTAIRLRQADSARWILTRRSWLRHETHELKNIDWQIQTGLLAETWRGRDADSRPITLHQRKGSTVENSVGRRGSIVGVNMT